MGRAENIITERKIHMDNLETLETIGEYRGKLKILEQIEIMINSNHSLEYILNYIINERLTIGKEIFTLREKEGV
jgi:hypothetical protein